MHTEADSQQTNQIKRQIQAAWDKLTDEDLDGQALKRQHIVIQIQAKYGLAKEQAENALKDWEIKHRSFLK